jgi:hypothetical protein
VRGLTDLPRAVISLTGTAYTAARRLLPFGMGLPRFRAGVPEKGGWAMPQRVISRETPSSREIEVVVYLPLRQDLWVYFRNGGVNVYFDVDAAAWEAFETTESKDSFIHTLPSYKVLVSRKKPD